MKQLTGVDAAFLSMETSNSYGHVNSLSIYERPDDPDFDAYLAWRTQVESRLDGLAPFRRRLVEVPLGIDRPYWVDDPDFDLDFHLRHLAVPPPGDRHQLEQLIGRLISRPLDRSRPLWESYVIEGLDDPSRFAVFTKIHHATIDGAAGAELTSLLLDRDPDDRPPPPHPDWRGEQVPSAASMLAMTAREMATRPGAIVRLQIHATRELARIARAQGFSFVADALRRPLPGPAGRIVGRLVADQDRHDEDPRPALPTTTAPPTPFNRSIGAQRRYCYGAVALDDIKALKNALGVTLNDVVMALCAGGLRSYLLEKGALPPRPLVTMVPVSIRTGEEEDRWTNRVAAIFPEIPTDVEDPLERVRAVHGDMDHAKAQFDLLPAALIMELADLAPPAVATRATRLASRVHIGDRMNPPFNLVISNVPGPRAPLYLSGAKLLHYYPISTIVEGQGLNVTVQSYLDTLDFGLVACRDLVPDLELVLEHILAEVDVLFDAVGASRPTTTDGTTSVDSDPTPSKSKSKAVRSADAGSAKKTRTKKVTKAPETPEHEAASR